MGHGGAGRPPTSGWRRWVYVLTGGLVNPGESPAELHRRDLVARANRPLISSHKIAMLSLKGGVGKTTVTRPSGRRSRRTAATGWWPSTPTPTAGR